MFHSAQNWTSKKDLFQLLQNKNGLLSSKNIFDAIFTNPVEFDNQIINYQVAKTSELIGLVKQTIKTNTFHDDFIGDKIAGNIDWAIFHRQIYPAICSAQIMDTPIQNLLDFVYCYSLLVVGPTQILDDKLDNPFASELGLKNKKCSNTELWALSDLMIRKGVELFLRLSPKAFNYIAPLTFDMTYSMYRENILKNYNEEILKNPQLILNLYTDTYSPDQSSIFNETLFIGSLIHLDGVKEEYSKLIPLARKLRLLRQQLNELEDFVMDLLCGFIKKPAALLLVNKRFGKEFGEIIRNRIWNVENIKIVQEKSFILNQVEYHEWIATQDYTKESLRIFQESGILEEIYQTLDKLCFSIVGDIEMQFSSKNCFDLLTVVYLKKALLERLNKFGFVPLKIENHNLEKLNY